MSDPAANDSPENTAAASDETPAPTPRKRAATGVKRTRRTTRPPMQEPEAAAVAAEPPPPEPPPAAEPPAPPRSQREFELEPPAPPAAPEFKGSTPAEPASAPAQDTRGKLPPRRGRRPWRDDRPVAAKFGRVEPQVEEQPATPSRPEAAEPVARTEERPAREDRFSREDRPFREGRHADRAREERPAREDRSERPSREERADRPAAADAADEIPESFSTTDDDLRDEPVAPRAEDAADRPEGEEGEAPKPPPIPDWREERLAALAAERGETPEPSAPAEAGEEGAESAPEGTAEAEPEARPEADRPRHGHGDRHEGREHHGQRRWEQQQGGGHHGQHGGKFDRNDRFNKKFEKNKFKDKKGFQQHGQKQGGSHPPPQHPQKGNQHPRGKFEHGKRRDWSYGNPAEQENVGSFSPGDLPYSQLVHDLPELERLAAEATGEPVDVNRILTLPLRELEAETQVFGLPAPAVPTRRMLVRDILKAAHAAKRPLVVSGVMEELEDGHGVLTFGADNYRVRGQSVFVPAPWVEKYGLRRGHVVEVQAHPPREGESCPFALKVRNVMGNAPEEVAHLTPFTELTPYYPLERIILETSPDNPWDNISMRVVDLLTPIGLGQRGLIVAPPRTGKTVLLQGLANAIAINKPNAHLIVLLIDERPEEVTDFRRQVKGEVISSTFDESAESHVHAAEMVIEKSRRMVESGKHVIILLDSITRLARAYNTLMPSSGKILSGGVEASALQKPKRFFGSARNIEGGGSLTIMATALVDTGSRMDEVIFEEFKGTGNMELHLDRALVDKRIFPSVNLERSGTRKEELLYHPDEMLKIYSLRRAMKGIPSTEAMEMLIQRVKKTKTNVEFLMGLNR